MRAVLNRGFFFGALLVLAAGCAESKKPVTGQVTFDGKPLEAGMIVFTPVDANVKAVGGAPIINGAYTIPGGEKGLPPGKYKVAITSGDNTKPKEETPGTGGQEGPGAERIPKQYNAETKLTADVTAAGPNNFDFKLDK